MGRDKATLRWEGRLLWEHQLATLGGLAAGGDLLFRALPARFRASRSCRTKSRAWARWRGLLASLRHAHSPWLLALAVDLPLISGELLAGLLRCAQEREAGSFRKTARGFEPLAAVYPKMPWPMRKAALIGGRRSLRPFVEGLMASGSAAPFRLRR